MKTIVIALITTTLTVTGYAQSVDDYIELTRDVIKTEKKAAIADVMQLSDAESTSFWTLYNEYESKQYGTQNKRIAIIKDFAANYENMDDVKADELWLNYLTYEQQLLKLKKAYYKKFKKILTPSQAARFFQAENKIQKLVDAHLASEIPLIGSL